MTQEILVSGNAFKAMLSHVNPNARISELTNEVKTAKSISKKDILIKQIKYLDGLQKTGLAAKDAYILHNLPVLPPQMRPASVRSANSIEFSDVNLLLKDHMTVNNALKDLVHELPPSELIKEREEAYNGIKAIQGIGEAISPNSKGRGVKGLLKQISGTTGPKTGLFHSKILSKKQDFSGRATIYSQPGLEFNQASVNVDQLWTMYKFHILRDLSKRGYTYVDSNKAWETRSPAATQAFNKVISDVPLIINRAPTLMKSNISAVYAVPTINNAMGINPLHLAAFAGDFDGDAQSLFVPMTPEAVKEAKEKLLMEHQVNDSRKGLNASLLAPGHEAILGSMAMTEPDMKQKVHKFKTEEECLKALAAGEIQEDTPVEIGGK